MQEVYVIAGGDWYRHVLNAVAAFMQTENWKIIERMCIGFSVLIVAGSWIKKHSVMDMLGWVFSLGEAVKIIGPDEVVEQMRGEARRLMEQYGE